MHAPRRQERAIGLVEMDAMGHRQPLGQKADCIEMGQEAAGIGRTSAHSF
jgi:hypothetical protein